jgi:divalent metal cation (Fe/Co/Zn/Cd) transporter
MSSILQTPTPDAARHLQRIQVITIIWMRVEAAVSLFAAWWARNPALLAFGGDSAIELFSGVVVLWRFRATAAHGDADKRAARVAGALLFVLAAFVVVTSVTSLVGYNEPKPTLLGIAILVAAAVVMPWLAKEKRRSSGATGSAALRSDAAQSALCAYLSLIALAGLAINAIWHVKWADPIAALAVLPLVVGKVGKRYVGRSAVVADPTLRIGVYPSVTRQTQEAQTISMGLQVLPVFGAARCLYNRRPEEHGDAAFTIK